ncbi:MAG TPA: DUF2059 domain-containing protein [Steroidobacteraceae bacterium]
MLFLYRSLGASLLSLAIAQSAYGDSGMAQPVSKDVVSLRQSVPGMNEGTDVNAAVDFLAPMQMRVIGGNDGTWRRDNPNWLPVLNLISRDLKKDLEPALVTQTAESAIRWNRELAAHLSAGQINSLLAFYHSDVGRRYLAFQKRLMAVQVQGTSALVAGMASGGMDPKEVAVSSPSAAQLDARKQLLALSWVIQIMPAMGAADPGRGASASADKTINDMLVDAVAKMRGPEIDALRRQYQDDLPAFSSFQESPAAKALIGVYRNVATDAAAEPVKPGMALMAVLQQSVAKHTPAWKAAYEAGRASAH